MEKLKMKKKQESIVEIMRDAILSGQLPSDAVLTQTELAEMLGVSRMPVREALLLMEYQGLIIRLNNHRFRIAEISRDYLMQIMDLAAMVEAEIIERMNIHEIPDDERSFHRVMLRTVPYPMHAKLFESILDIYAGYVFSLSSYQENSKNWEKLHLALLSGVPKNYRKELRHYYHNLAEAILEERSIHVGTKAD